MIDGLEPGMRVTTARFVDHDEPIETTVLSDGSPITLTGSANDIFVATVTDDSGALVALHAMGSGCTLRPSRQLRVPQEYPTIQAAVDAAQPGDTVKVGHGVFTESVHLRPYVCLLGSGPASTILDARGQPITLVDLSGAPGSVVAGFTMRGTVQAEGYPPLGCIGDYCRSGLFIGGSHAIWDDPTNAAPPLVAFNVFTHNDIGVTFYWRSQAILRNNIFVANRAGFLADHYQNRTLVANNVFFANTELAISNDAAYLDIIDNIIVGSAVGIRFEAIQTGHIRNNIFSANGLNQYDPTINPDRFTIGTDGNIEIDPLFVAPDAGDFHLRASSPAIDGGFHAATALELDGTRPDIGAYGGPLGSWTVR